MNQLTKFGVVILTATALACWLVPVLAGPTVPYKDSVEGTTELNFTGPLTAIQTVDGTGVATHLGLVQVSGQHTLTFDAPPAPGVTGTVTNGHITYTAADGSTIDAGYDEGTFVIVSTNPPLLLFSIPAEFSNGTGRLEGVTGQADIDVTGHLGSFTYNSDGTLTYPNRP